MVSFKAVMTKTLCIYVAATTVKMTKSILSASILKFLELVHCDLMLEKLSAAGIEVEIGLGPVYNKLSKTLDTSNVFRLFELKKLF